MRIPGWTKTLAVMLVLAFVFSGFYTMATPASIFDGWNTTGEIKDSSGIKTGIDSNKPEYVGSWLPNLNSETMVFTGKVFVSYTATQGFKSYRYALYVQGSETVKQRYPPDGSWVDYPIGNVFGAWGILNVGASNRWHTLQPWSTEIKSEGNIHIKVVIEYKSGDILFQTHTHSEPNDLGWDGANIQDGYCDIYIRPSDNQGPFEEGDTAKVYAKTGYAGVDGWFVAFQPPADRTDLDQTLNIVQTLENNIPGTILSIEIPTGAYKDESTNRWELQLWNKFFMQKFTYLLSIDDIARAPIISEITTVNNGDSYTFTVTTERTYAEVQSISVSSWYAYAGGFGMPARSDTESWIDMDVSYSVSGNNATFTVTPKNTDGTIVVYVVAYDGPSGTGRPSAPKYFTFIVKDGSTDDIDNNPLTQPLIWTLLLIIIAAVLVIAIAAIWTFGWYAQVKWYVLLILSSIVGIVGYLALYFTWVSGL